MHHVSFSNLITGIDSKHTFNNYQLTIDQIFNQLPLDSILYYEFKSPTISGYSGRKSIISDAILDAAIREWTALCDERRQAHVNELIYQLGKTLPTASHHIILQDTHVLAGDHMGNPSFLKSACPETFVGLLKELNDDHLEQHLSICHHLTSSNPERMTETPLVHSIVSILSNLFSDSMNGGNALAKSICPIAFDVLALISETSNGRAQLGVPSVVKVLFDFMDYANNKGDLMTSQIPVAIAILASALFQSSSETHSTVSSRTVTPFPSDLTLSSTMEISHVANSATRLDVRANALWVHITYFNARKHEHTDSDVEENVRLMFETKSWAKMQLDVPGLVMRYLSGTPEQKLKYLTDDPTLKNIHLQIKENEVELYEEIMNHVDILQKRSLLHNSNDQQQSSNRQHRSAPLQKTARFKQLLDDREDRLHEIMLVCLIGLWHYLRDCNGNVSRTLARTLADVGIQDVFAMCQATEYPEVQRCAFGTLSELCRMNISQTFQHSIVELVVVLVEKKLHSIKEQQEEAENDENDATKNDNENQNQNENNNESTKANLSVPSPATVNNGDDGCSDPLLYLALQFAKEESCRDVFVDRKFADTVLNIGELLLNNESNIITIRVCMAILLHLHDPNEQVTTRTIQWLKSSKCDDVDVHIYVTLGAWRTLLVHSECRDTWINKKGLEITLRRLSKLINVMKRSGRQKVHVHQNPKLLTLLKALLGLIWISVGGCDDLNGNTIEQENRNLFVAASGVNLVAYFLRWQEAPSSITNMAITIIWLLAKRREIQEQIIRVGLVRVFVKMIKNKRAPFEQRATACNVFEIVAMHQQQHVEKELNKEHVLENVLLNFLQVGNDDGIQVYGLCGLARVAFSSKKEAAVLVQMGVVTQVLECIENSMELLLDLNKKLYGEDDDEDENDTVVVEGKVEDVDMDVDKETEKETAKKIVLSYAELKEKKRLMMVIVAKCLHLLMNLTVVRETQVLVGKIGLGTIFKSCEVDQSHQDQETDKLAIEIKMYAERVISNLSKHEKNRTPLYKMELKLKGKSLKQQQQQHQPKPETTTKTKEINRAKLQEQKKRIQKRRNIQMQAFLNRQKLARYKDTSERASTLKYEAKFDKWKEKNECLVRPPSIFASGIGNKTQNNYKNKNKNNLHIAMRPSLKKQQQQQQHKSSVRLSTTSPIRASAARRPQRGQRGQRGQRPQSARVIRKGNKKVVCENNSKSTKIRIGTSSNSSNSRNSRKNILATRPKQKRPLRSRSNGLIRTMCKPIIDLFNHGKDDNHRKSKIKESVGVVIDCNSQNNFNATQQTVDSEGSCISILGGQTLHPVPFSKHNGRSNACIEQQNGRNIRNKTKKYHQEDVISSYLKPLQYSGEDEYTPWNPRIKNLKSTKQYKKPKDKEPTKADGAVPITPHSPGKPPDANASKDIKAQYLYNLQQYVQRQAKKKKGRNDLLWKPQLGQDRIDFVSNPVTCALSSTSKPFEFRLGHQYSNRQPEKVQADALKNSGRGGNVGNITLALAERNGNQAANQLSTHLHREGATVFDGILDRYIMEDGRQMYFYHKHTLHEQESPSMQPQNIPDELNDLGLAEYWRDPVPPLIHDDSTMTFITNRNDIILQHPPLLSTPTDVMEFLIGKDIPRPMIETTIKPPYLPPVFLLRYASSDTQSLYNNRYDALDLNVQQISFDLDWKRMTGDDYLITSLFKHSKLKENENQATDNETKDVLQTISLNLYQAIFKHYSNILQLFTYYASMGDGTIRGIQLNAFRAFVKDTKIMKLKKSDLKSKKPKTATTTTTTTTTPTIDRVLLDEMYLDIDSPAMNRDQKHGKETKKKTKASIEHNKSLVRFEFMILLVQLALTLYKDRAVDQAFHVLMTRHVIHSLNGVTSTKSNKNKKSFEGKQKQLNQLKQILIDQDDFREERLYTRQVNVVYQHFLTDLHKIFIRYSSSRTVITGTGVQLFLHTIKKKANAKKLWKKLKKKRKSILMKSLQGKGKNTLLKKKAIRKMGGKTSTATSKENKQKEDMIKMMAPKFVRDISRADAMIALAGYHQEEDGSLYETLMPLENWLLMLHHLSLIGQGLSVREATWAFSWSIMHVKDELSNKNKRHCLSFTDFLEAFGRLAEIYPVPTMNEISKNGSDSVQSYVKKHRNIILKVKQGGSKRRESSQNMVTEKHRGLDEKLFVLLSTLIEKIHDENVIAKRFNLHNGKDVNFHDEKGDVVHAFQ